MTSGRGAEKVADRKDEGLEGSGMFTSLRHTGRQGFRAVPRDRVLISVVSGAIAPPWRYVEDSPGPRRWWLSATNGGRLFLPLATSILRLDQLGAIPCRQHSVSHGGPLAPVAKGMLREPPWSAGVRDRGGCKVGFAKGKRSRGRV
jgi:hypothetical protein